jgi:hypothetical protein
MVVGLFRRLEPTMHRTCQITIRTATFGKYQRYVLMDQRGRYWTGDGWAADLHRALRHADILGAHQEYQRVMEQLYQDKPVRTFEATIKVQVFTDQPFGVEALRDYLERASRFSQDTERMGDGPVEGCLVLQWADYSTLEEVKPTAKDSAAR